MFDSSEEMYVLKGCSHDMNVPGNLLSWARGSRHCPCHGPVRGTQEPRAGRGARLTSESAGSRRMQVLRLNSESLRSSEAWVLCS